MDLSASTAADVGGKELGLSDCIIGVPAGLCNAIDANQTIQAANRQRMKQHAIDDADERRIRADAQLQHGHHDQRESGAPS